MCRPIWDCVSPSTCGFELFPGPSLGAPLTAVLTPILPADIVVGTSCSAQSDRRPKTAAGSPRESLSVVCRAESSALLA
jgi:hypothetical protein